MNDEERAVLLRVVKALERAASELRKLIGKPNEDRARPEPIPLPAEFVEELKNTDRSHAADMLAPLPQSQLAEVYVNLGGASRDRKRNKEWLTERILWLLFDFERGHKIIRGEP
jgi:hypothetical protein